MRGRVRLATFTLLASVLWVPYGAAQEAASKGVYRATTDRLAMRFGFYSPSGRVGSVDLSEVNRWVAARVEENTDLDVSELDGQVVDRCVESSGARKRLTCLVEESSEEWIAMRSSLPQSFSEVRNRLRASRTHPRYVLILSATSVEGGDRIAVLLIDVEDALGRVHARRSKPNPPSPEDLAAIEEEISRYSVLARPPIEDGVTSTEQMKDYVQRLIEQQLRDALVGAGHWRPFGSIQVHVGVSDPFAIELDGVSLGATVDGKATLLDVRPGERRIVLENEDFEELATSAKVETGKIAEVRVTPIKKPSQVIFVIRQAVLWGGVASTAAGISLIIYALARPFERKVYCFHSEGDTSICDSDPFIRFGGSEDMVDATSNGGGSPILPLGYSLLGLGTAWMLGPLIDGDPERIPWIEAVVGLVVFGTAFGLSLGLDNRDPVCDYHKSC